MGNTDTKPSLIARTVEFMENDDSDLESNISFAETLFPVTPPKIKWKLHDDGIKGVIP
jgi:hypothetical protein